MLLTRFLKRRFSKNCGGYRGNTITKFKENIKSQFRIRLESEDIITIQDIIRMSEQLDVISDLEGGLDALAYALLQHLLVLVTQVKGL